MLDANLVEPGSDVYRVVVLARERKLVSRRPSDLQRGAQLRLCLRGQGTTDNNSSNPFDGFDTAPVTVRVGHIEIPGLGADGPRAEVSQRRRLSCVVDVVLGHGCLLRSIGV
jgi:hypothetical protein